jgi:predicted phosphate transport protein (TIGR00153 family)
MVRLVPKEEKYFELMRELAAKVRESGEIFIKTFQDYPNHERYAEQIKAVETSGDELMAKIMQKLNTSFITPIDREDIYLLVTELDDVIDMINDIAHRLGMYDITAPRKDVHEIVEVLSRATLEIKDAFTLLERHESVADRCRKISQLEKQADSLYSAAIRRLFREEKDAIEVIKWMSIYEALENCVDRCKDVSEALEAVVVKNK